MTQSNQRLRLTPKEVMEVTGLSRDTVYRLLRAKVIPSIDISTRKKKRRHKPTYLIPREALEKWLRESTKDRAVHPLVFVPKCLPDWTGALSCQRKSRIIS